MLDRIEAEQQQPTLPSNITALELLRMVYRGEFKARAQQMRAAIESLPFENPKLSAVAIDHLTGEAFAERLDRVIARSDRAKLIDLKPVPTELDQ